MELLLPLIIFIAVCLITYIIVILNESKKEILEEIDKRLKGKE